ncbi:hypothetical protein RUM43_014549 [Polyplax serrata]|uniref:Uncharacterized protein n=1 Tax=Polyplax serrata TaxID=468196 RepID=A0AAN8P109_POLSC
MPVSNWPSLANGYCDEDDEDDDDDDDDDDDVIREIKTLLIVKVNETCYLLSLARIEDGSIYTCVPPVLLQKPGEGKYAIKSGWPGSEKRALSGPGQMPEA